MAFSKIYDGAEPVRLNKWLGLSGVCSRREADVLIADGFVTVDGETVRDAGRKIVAGQTVTVDREAAGDAPMTVIYHKPVGIVSGQPEPRANVFGPADLYPDHTSKLAPIGRLDKDSRGLLILSEDGVLAKAVIGPQSELDKHYHVKVRGKIIEAKLVWLRHGLELDGKPLRPAEVTQTDEQSLTFILREGRKRQIRRMCDMVELRVVDLYRDRIGPLSLGDLPEGQWRLMTPAEREAMIAAGRG
ncbi:MAG: rRNA pseudouridine synthase [Asticcacaulis sp.]|nr:rRNA pseudouridine synthase [Asticcacaulis sp.]